MLFNSYTFILLYLPITLLVYYGLAHFRRVKAATLNIPVPEYRQSGKTETEVPEYWKPLFRKIGNRHRVPARC